MNGLIVAVCARHVAFNANDIYVDDIIDGPIHVTVVAPARIR